VPSTMPSFILVMPCLRVAAYKHLFIHL
jgi:hypothetical protein